MHAHAQSNSHAASMLCMGVASNSGFANIYFVNFLLSPICKNKVKYKFPGIRYMYSDCHFLNDNRDLMQKGHNVTPTFFHTAVTAPLYWQWPVYNTVTII